MIFNNIKSEKDLDNLKRDVVKNDDLYRQILIIRKKLDFKRSAGEGRKKTKRFPTNAEMLALYREMVKNGEEKTSLLAEFYMRKIKTKSNSGIVSVSILTKPFLCPGKCIYCPTEKQMPKSYLSKEPAAARALRNNFDPYKQVYTRLKSLEMNGHSLDKVEIIVIGGTWSSYPDKYQKDFVSEVFRACNNYGNKKQIKKKEKNFVLLQKINEKAKSHIIGISIETRPDFINLKEIKKLRELGVTKVEIGVQHLDDSVLDANRRGISSDRVAEATAMLRANGFKIVYHMMLNLYDSSPKKDIKMFEQLFSDARFQPDMLKIYPCVLLKNTGPHKIWKKGEHSLYSDDKLRKVLKEVKKLIPTYVRVIRVIRDIPASYIIAGSKISNMRQFLMKDQKEEGWRCRCVRCREIREEDVKLNNIKLVKKTYIVSGGKEYFLSWEDVKNDKLVAFLRLFLPVQGQSLDGGVLGVLRGLAVIREIHTYGRLIPVAKVGNQSQHRGFGKSLMEEAEKISQKDGYSKIAVIAGVGTRDYYRKLGYKLKDTYMVKSL